MPYRYWGRATFRTPAYRAKVDCRRAVIRPDREHDRSCPKSWHDGRDWYWPLADLTLSANVRFAPILLQKSFRGSERKFLEPLMRFTRGDARDHIASSEIDHGPP